MFVCVQLREAQILTEELTEQNGALKYRLDKTKKEKQTGKN